VKFELIMDQIALTGIQIISMVNNVNIFLIFLNKL
jgi:hypothetical protein